MSTFDGIVAEFPDIQIDNFRFHPGRRAPAACFLSHVHSDHLLGLESLRMPFVYCSAATKRMLLRMEKYPHRINFAKGILEARKLTYKHLRFVLRALPLQTPVELELGPNRYIRVTLFDANHCPGSVMFLVEGDGKAILYTGDIRADSWWVNSIAREPVLIPYVSGQKFLDCIYLDTTFASHDDVYKNFPSKSEGLQELLQKIAKCPDDSIFYVRAWTLGYEDVWIAISNLIQSRVHVDSYQIRLFGSIMEDRRISDQVAALTGFELGNQSHPGCLTLDSNTRIHSCEPGTACYASLSKNKKVIWVTPIISRLADGTEIAEVGAGGGGGDLYVTSQLEMKDEEAFETLHVLCDQVVKDPESRKVFEHTLGKAKRKGNLDFNLEDLELDQDADIPLKDFISALSNQKQTNKQVTIPLKPQLRNISENQRKIHFSYSRHSSYDELRYLISLFRPKDICPCTVDMDEWSEDFSMQSLFGDLCSGQTFEYDRSMRFANATSRMELENDHNKRRHIEEDSQRTDSQDTDAQIDTFPVLSDSLQGSLNSKPQELGGTLSLAHKSAGIRQLREQGENISPGPWQNYLSPREKLHKAWRAQNDDSDVYQESQLQGKPFRVTDDGLDGHKISSEHKTWKSGALIGTSADDRSTIEEKASVDNVGADHERIESDLESVNGPDRTSRKLAYDAAIHCLDRGDSSVWDNLRLRSLGWKGHTKEELEL